MTTTNDTRETTKPGKDTATWLRKGRAGLQVIRRIEAGTIDESIGSVPVGVTADGDHLLSLCENGSIWIMPNGPVSEAFKEPDVLPAAKVAMLYRFFWPMLVAEVCEIATAVDATKKARQAAYVDRVLSYSPADDPYPTTINLRIAPNCEGDILTHPPRIVTIDGSQFVQLKGHDGWDGERYPVLEVTRMDAHDGLVLVATPEQVFLMTAADFDNPIE